MSTTINLDLNHKSNTLHIEPTTMKYKLTEIAWDLDYYVDEADLELPVEMTIELFLDADATEEDIDEALCNAASEATGFCLFQFSYEVIEENKKTNSNN